MQNENKITIEECQKLLEQNPFGSLLQMKITEAEQGRVKAELPFKKEFTNIYGDLHGGVLYSAVVRRISLSKASSFSPAG